LRLPLAIFPAGLEGTLLVPVLVGVLVMLALHDCWGWDFVGLVVPGYLCSLLMLQPLVAAVVLVEAVATWALARGLDAAGVRLGLTFPVFGRDRFYLVLVSSVIVRVLVEAVLLQRVASAVAPHWPALAAHRHELFGIGLVLAPLTANRFWRGGLRRGLLQLGVETMLVWVVVGLVLARLTNFSLAGFDLAYDHLALSFLSSPQAQITLLVTAALASAFNRRYGWDFHGILVPALLALAVATPLKLAATVVEALLVMGLGRALVSLPVARGLDVDGPRRVVLCLVIGFALKLIAATTMTAQWPGYRPSDFFGFGYLVPSLLAERIWVRDRPALILLPTLQTALGGLVLAAGVLRVVSAVSPATTSVAMSVPAPIEARPASGLVEDGKLPARALAMHGLARSIGDPKPPPAEAIVAAAAAIHQWRHDPAGLARVVAPWGLTVFASTDGRLVVAGGAWPVLVLRSEPRAVVAAAHADELHAGEAALWAGDLLAADTVLATIDEGAATLAVALSARASTPVLFLRGTAVLPGGDAMVLARPTGSRTPSWLAPLTESLRARFMIAAGGAIDNAALSAFPPGLDPMRPAALLWLSASARRALGSEPMAWAARPDVALLAASRGVPSLHVDLGDWLASSAGAPTPATIERAERVARSRDMTRLGRQQLLLVDEGRGLAAIGADEQGRRSLSLLGARTEERIFANAPAEVAPALDRGTRTVVAGVAP
jgi:hypothetical protein